VPHSGQAEPPGTENLVGHYEGGDTLVVDTIGFNDRTFVDSYRTPHTTALHVTERFKLADGGTRLDVPSRSKTETPSTRRGPPPARASA